MDFKQFFLRELATKSERDDFAARAGSTRGYLNQIAYGNKRVELGFADALVAASDYQIDLDSLPLTEDAKKQNHVRTEGTALTIRQAA